MEQDQDLEETSSRKLAPSEKWQKEIQVSEKALRSFWTRGRRIVRKYLSDDDAASQGLQMNMNIQKYNIFWANVGILKASLYANPPKPLVKREFDDFQDQIGRVAAEIMQRMLTQPFEKPESDMNTAFYKVVEDRLVPGLGQIWLRYVPEIQSTTYPKGTMGPADVMLTDDLTVDHIVSETVCTDYIYWEDFLWSPCRNWEECRWVARRVHLTRQEFVDRFGKAAAGLVPWSRKGPKEISDRVTPEDYGVSKTEVFELWDKPSQKVYWLSQNCAQLLDEQDDPLKIMGFFPCPRPLLATTTTSSLVPKADYIMTQTQYRRLDNLTMRIGLLEDAIQASGVYDKSNKELSQLLSGNMNKMIPVDNWAMFSDKGGLKGVVDWFPLEMVVNALDKLRQLKEDAKAELFELTGISDIMRGSTAPRETAMAQGLKAQYSSVRLQYMQGEVSFFIQEALRIKAEIIAHHFQPKSIIDMSLIMLTPDGEYAEPAVQVIKDLWQKHYRIQVFSSDLAIPDYNAERQGRTEFISAMGQYISQIIPLVQMEPRVGPFLMQILQWGVASFRSASSIEGVFSKAITEITKMSQEPKKEPPPDPKLMAANAKIQADAAKHQQNMQQDQAKFVMEMQQDKQQFAQKQALEQQDSNNRDRSILMEKQTCQAEQDAKTTEMITKAVIAALNHRATLEQKTEEHNLSMGMTADKHAQAMQQAKEKPNAKT